jgi:putative salt-induced outer membrane protein YdiY
LSASFFGKALQLQPGAGARNNNPCLFVRLGESIVKLKSISLLLAVPLWLGSSSALAQGAAAAQIADAPACDCPAPKNPEDWGTSLALGFTLTEGNSNTLLLTSALTASREKNGNLWDLRLAGAYGENEVESTNTVDGVETTTSENQQSVGEIVALAKYGRLLSERAYVGAQADFLHDALQDIKYRVTLGVPFGYFLIKDDNLRLNVEAGPSYTFSKVGQDELNSAGWFASQRLEWDISETAKVFEQVTYNGSFEGQDLEDGRSFSASDNYYVVAEAGLEAALSSSMSLVVSVRDDYINIVDPANERNDLSVVTAIKVAL